MQKFVLIKPITHVQIGHLYEHLFCMHLIKLFRSCQLYSYIDYSIDAKTYYNGVVVIEIELYSAGALKLKPQLVVFKPVFSEEDINVGLLQIMAEKYADVEELDTEYITDTLEELNSTAWQMATSFKDEAAADESIANEGLVLTPRDHAMFKMLRHELSLNSEFAAMEKQYAWPIFAALSDAIGENLREHISDHYFCFTYEDSGKYTDSEVIETNKYRVDARAKTELDDELQTSKELVSEMMQSGFVEKLAHFLQNADESVPMSSPDTTTIYEKTKLQMKPKDWKEIGTTANIQAVLDHTSLRFTYGSQEQKASLL